MKIIDFERKGNLIRFYLGTNDDNTYRGENWEERPYELQQNNKVYDSHITGHRDIVFPFNTIVCEPRDGHKMSRYSKDDMKARRCACVVAMLPEFFDEDEYSWLYENDFDMVASDGRSIKFFFGDYMDPSEDIEIYGQSNNQSSKKNSTTKATKNIKKKSTTRTTIR